MLILLYSSVSVSGALEDLGDRTFGFPSPECHHIKWFIPNRFATSHVLRVRFCVSCGASRD
jgi:hypothetical protein